MKKYYIQYDRDVMAEYIANDHWFDQDAQTWNFDREDGGLVVKDSNLTRFRYEDLPETPEHDENA